MSLILEALKKAERQHKLGKVPGISGQASEQESQAGSRLRWGLLSLMGLAILAVGLYLGGIQNRSQPDSQPQVNLKPEPATKTAPVAEPARPPGELTVRPVRAGQGATGVKPQPEAAPVVTQAPPVKPMTQATQPVDKPGQPTPQPVVTVKPLQVPPPPAPKPPPPRAIPLHDMPGGFVSNLPAMNIDIHSYDPRPLKRYVLVNMEKYREGDYLAEGPLLIEILPEGVIMEHMGERFIFPLGNL
ncbi:MAG: general secretion pathway protein GspB [Candidatus Thiodiazotropha lotti]|uniref:Type II secretion system protein GspB C-terminal domain-containing protein n=1 Tax=Candidatus Thiodiazotropha endoloripes TaxID=1818881 RepID=A0A1E2UP46_9GAMM|nr:general secretion pathway protein GspB [Candidatus Thiodiazotropha endoloripes]MCG7897781.1 general secretion pathway protein GspB [Candidatus Thiodiazotropha weberae]MCG7993511.1 general secretion pathway protein GspB [Candidatus Thiodiazotropha lotti]MCG7901190.1 general secretion pathway protein GspB [Candidatus Thiodiazotropha weberae]MCG7913211.1 general secretion pathway protein GspB [Candidatus Thiodiazotropha weberae]MCG7997970.1 general secretion pathway protein GspB [Candidatus Th